MLFYLLHAGRYYDDYVRSGQYTASPIYTHLGREFWELKDKLFGIIGMGTIGRRGAGCLDGRAHCRGQSASKSPASG
ncbi:MAG: hypothetical protein STSR0003_27410 [Smithella sp.]